MSQTKITQGDWYLRKPAPKAPHRIDVRANVNGKEKQIASIHSGEVDARAIAAVPKMIEALRAIATPEFLTGDQCFEVAIEALRSAGIEVE